MNRELESTAIYSQLNTRIRIIMIQYVLIKTCIIIIIYYYFYNRSITQNSRSTKDLHNIILCRSWPKFIC